MAKNICPKCSQVTLSFDDVEEIKCPVCSTIFRIENDDPEPAESSLM